MFVGKVPVAGDCGIWMTLSARWCSVLSLGEGYLDRKWGADRGHGIYSGVQMARLLHRVQERYGLEDYHTSASIR